MIFQADAILKSSIELMIEDMRKNVWLLDDVFSDFQNNPYLKKKFSTQIQNAKDWFLNNKIYIELGYVEDTTDLPRISIVLGPEDQDTNMSTMGDTSTESVKLLPNCIDKPIPFMVKPFTPISYNAGTGILVAPPLPDLYQASVGQILVNTSTGKGFPITKVVNNNISIAPLSFLGTGLIAVVPKHAFWEAKIEHIWQTVQYQIICTGNGEAQTAIWLHNIAFYGLMRYKQGLLEALSLYESVFSSTALQQNPNFTNSGEAAWERTINIAGRIEQKFIKAPHRIIETAQLIDTSPGPESEWTGGITISSNSDPFTDIQKQMNTWIPIEDDEE